MRVYIYIYKFTNNLDTRPKSGNGTTNDEASEATNNQSTTSSSSTTSSRKRTFSIKVEEEQPNDNNDRQPKKSVTNETSLDKVDDSCKTTLPSKKSRIDNGPASSSQPISNSEDNISTSALKGR